MSENDQQSPTSPDPVTRVPLRGSERTAAPGVAGSTPLPDDATVEATVVLRRRTEVPEDVLEHPLPRSEFDERYGADPADVRTAVDALSRAGLTIVDTSAPQRRIRVSGPAAVVGAVFGTSLAQVSSEGPNGTSVTHRHRTGGLSLPAELDGIVVAVLGLDDRPQARTMLRVAEPSAVSSSYTPVQVADLYSFPPGTDGSGRSVAIIELGGGYEQSDLDTYFSGLGLQTPTVTAIGVDGADNVPGQDPNGADPEVLLDIEVIGAIAPKAAISVYFAPNTDSGFVDAVTQAAHADPAPAAISISWGQSEDSWTASARTALDQAIVDAVGTGITVTVAAGDNGSSDGATGGAVHVDFPASSPHALACGGTRLEANTSTDTITSETVWNDGSSGGSTGGGVSDAFALPSWQQSVGVPASSGGATGRGVPDVAGNADPQTGYSIRVDGKDMVVGGTSAVAPLWAALIARIVQSTGSPLGLAQPALYQGAAAGTDAAGFRDITSGNNGAYSAGPGWDACTGLGSPDGSALLGRL
jgi:kumamolisin